VDPLESLRPVSDAAEVRALIATVRNVHVSEAVQQYAVDLVTATRNAPDLRLGASPRATLHLIRTARAVSALAGREYVLPDDLQSLAVPVLASSAAYAVAEAFGWPEGLERHWREATGFYAIIAVATLAGTMLSFTCSWRLVESKPAIADSPIDSLARIILSMRWRLKVGRSISRSARSHWWTI